MLYVNFEAKNTKLMPNVTCIAQTWQIDEKKKNLNQGILLHQLFQFL